MAAPAASAPVLPARFEQAQRAVPVPIAEAALALGPVRDLAPVLQGLLDSQELFLQVC